MNYDPLFQHLRRAGFGEWVEQLQALHENWFSERHHGDYQRWSRAFDLLPEINDMEIHFDRSEVLVQGQVSDPDALNQALKILRPWRKGPFRIGDTHIDSEWRSDFKWDRVKPHLSELGGRRILDVGCGNGYHAWRMLEGNPDLVLGIDPSVLFNMQFQVVQHYARDPRIFMLPVAVQHMPENMAWFHTVFSMGVLYHRRSPFDHLMTLRGLLQPGGELCLETLVIEGGSGQVLVPDKRYARMNNVWFLPSVDELAHWLDRVGFHDIRIVDISKTTTCEQRSTEWMQFESLEQCLDPNNPELTVEGYPAPIRAVVIATR